MLMADLPPEMLKIFSLSVFLEIWSKTRFSLSVFLEIWSRTEPKVNWGALFTCATVRPIQLKIYQFTHYDG
jgi:hypothetical protein